MRIKLMIIGIKERGSVLLCFCLSCKEYYTAINKQWSVGGSCADHGPDGHRSEPSSTEFCVPLH